MPGRLALNCTQIVSGVIVFWRVVIALNSVAALVSFSATLSARDLPRPSDLSSAGRQQQSLKPLGVVRGDGRDDFRRDLLGRNRLPRIDHAVFLGADAPAAAAGVEPATLIDLAVVVRVDVAIDLQPVLVVAPLIDDIVVVGVDELPQDHAVGTFDDPADVAVDLLGDDLALGGLFGALAGRNRRPAESA